MTWNPYENLPSAASFSLTSSDLKEGEKLAMPQVSGVFGAGPPEGTGKHRYIFAALALDAEKIEIDKEATPAWLMFKVFDCTLARAFLEGWYER